MPHPSLAARINHLEDTVDRLRRLSEEMAAGFARIDERFAQIDDRLAHIDQRFVQMLDAIIQGDEESRRFMRVLHEEAIARIAVLGERS